MTQAPAQRRPLFVAYALVCYAAFLALSVYAVGFVGNYWAPLGWTGPWLRSLDGGVSEPLGQAIAFDTALIALFGVQHSVMARKSFKHWLARFLAPELERSTYVLLATLCLALLFWQWRPIGPVIWDTSRTAAGLLLGGISLVGWLVVVRSTFLIDHAALFGLRQVFAGAEARSEGEHQLKTPGLYRAVRHPLYLGFLIAFWASPSMTAGHLVFAAGMTLYVLIGIGFEERDLTAQFGSSYADYQKRVRALLPFPRLK